MIDFSLRLLEDDAADTKLSDLAKDKDVVIGALVMWLRP